MFGIGGTELLIVLIFAFIVFGPDKLPEFAKTLGKAIAKFRDIRAEVDDVVRTEVYDPDDKSDDPFKKPIATLERMTSDPDTPRETFAERKARYDRERAARKKAEAEKAKADIEAETAKIRADAAAAEAAENVGVEGAEGAAGSETAGASANENASDATETSANTAAHVDNSSSKPAASASALFGIAEQPSPSTPKHAASESEED